MVAAKLMILLASRPAVVAVWLVPMMSAPAVPPEPMAITPELSFRERKSVAVMAPPAMETVPAKVVPTPSMVRLPLPDLVRSLPVSVPTVTLAWKSVFPFPATARIRGLLAVLPSERVRLPVNLRAPPASLVSVFVRELAEAFASVV